MKIETTETGANRCRMQVTVPPAMFEEAVRAAYRREKGKYRIDGYRQGRAPLQAIERARGKTTFYQSAAQILIQQLYPQAVAEKQMTPVSYPEISVVSASYGEPFSFVAEFDTEPVPVLGQYKGLKVPKAETAVTDAEIELAIGAKQREAAWLKSVERPSRNGDRLLIDYTGSCDGEQFEGGTAELQELELGGGSFFPGFEEQLTGAVAGETRKIQLSFPEDYPDAAIAGRRADFRVEVRAVGELELPALDDEFARDCGYDALTQMAEEIKRELGERKAGEAATEEETAAVDAVCANTAVEIPESMIRSAQDELLRQLEESLDNQGATLEQYYGYSGQSEESVRESFRPAALAQVKTRLVLKAVARAEGITVTEEDYREKLREMAEEYEMSPEELEAAVGGSRPLIEEEILNNKAIDLIVGNTDFI